MKMVPKETPSPNPIFAPELSPSLLRVLVLEFPVGELDKLLALPVTDSLYRTSKPRAIQDTELRLTEILETTLLLYQFGTRSNYSQLKTRHESVFTAKVRAYNVDGMGTLP